MKFNSIRLKLTLWYSAILALLIISFAVITYFSVERIFRQETEKNLLELSKNFVFAVNEEQNSEDDKPPPPETVREVIKEFKFKDSYIFVFSEDGQTIAKTHDADLPSTFPLDSYATFRVDKQRLRVFSTSFTVGNSTFKLSVCRSLAENFEVIGRLRNFFLLTIPFALLFAIGFGYLLAKRSLKPVYEIGQQAKNITANNLNSRLLVKNDRDEIGSLASVFNDLLERLEYSFEQQKRFMADASHELRTPLAIVRGESEVALSKKDRPNKDLRESLEIVNDESKRLTKIVEDLFTLSRADAGQFAANFKQVYLDEILTDCVRNMRVLADKKQLSIEITTEETAVRSDEQLLRRLFLNLLDNAVKYNREGGSISVALANKRVTISDTGHGIPEEDRTKIFERFYRTDKARSRAEESSTSGAGLGLSIAKWIAELHQADLQLVRSDEDGSVFSVQF